MKFLNTIVLVSFFFKCFFSLFGDQNRPNVILIFTDDQGYGDLSCFGSTKIKKRQILIALPKKDVSLLVLWLPRPFVLRHELLC